MILDDYLELADGQSSTTSVASTNVVNTVAAGDAYEGEFFLVRIDTAFVAANGAPTATFQLQTSDQEGFGGVAVTLIQTDAFVAADLAAGKQIAIRIPPGAKKYLRGYNSCTSTAANFFNAGAWDMYICTDVDTANNQRDLIV